MRSILKPIMLGACVSMLALAVNAANAEDPEKPNTDPEEKKISEMSCAELSEKLTKIDKQEQKVRSGSKLAGFFGAKKAKAKVEIAVRHAASMREAVRDAQTLADC